MTAKERAMRIFLNFSFPEPSRKQMMWFIGALISVFGGGNFALNMHNSNQNDAMIVKVDSAKTVVDSTVRPRFTLRADVDTVKREIREASKLLKELIKLSDERYSESRINHFNDSSANAFTELKLGVLNTRMSFVETEVQRH